MPPFYTKKGDDGLTNMLGSGRIPKHHPRMETLGSLDEASAALGLARSLCRRENSSITISEIQGDLINIMAEVAAAPEHAERFRSLDSSRLAWLESQIDTFSESIIVPNGFTLPGASQAGAAAALARTIVRRAERHLSRLLDLREIENDILLKYLNRLSSFCFVLELFEDESEI